MMKKSNFIKIIFVFIIILSGGIFLAACNKGSDDPNNPPEPAAFNVDLNGYVANIGNATAIGISSAEREIITTTKDVQIISSRKMLSSGKNNEKNYLVMSTNDNVPNSNDELVKVSFSKITADNTQQEISGTKRYISNNNSISFSVEEAFEYDIYDNQTLIYDNVQDNDDLDSNKRTGIVKIENLENNKEYKVKYRGLGKEIVKTQDDLNAEIDKFYVCNGYTFICFAPEGKSVRPNESELVYDDFNVATYDKREYFTNSVYQSFVIDNSTGYVYKLNEIGIDEIRNNLVVISNKVHDMSVSNNGELQFVPIVQNESIEVVDFFKDKYGNKYICNKQIEIIDDKNNTLYYKNPEQDNKYFFSKEGVVISYIDGVIKKMNKDFNLENISQNENYFINKLCVIKDGYFYNTQKYYRINLNNMKKELSFSWVFQIGEIYHSFIDYNTVVVYTRENNYGLKAKSVCYQSVFGENGIIDPQVQGNGEAFIFETVLVEDADAEVVNNSDFRTWKFKKITLMETTYYKIVLNQKGIPNIVDYTYVAPAPTIITLQPVAKLY